MNQLHQGLALAPSLLLLGTAVAVARRREPASVWQMARRGLQLAAVLVAVAVGTAWGFGVAWLPQAAVLPLIVGLGLVLVGYCANYLAGQPHQARFAAWLLATLAGAALVVVTEHVGVLVAAWFGTSLALQRLLVFFADRPGAQMAAHKKFLVSRTADLCMLTAAGLLGTRAATFDLDTLLTQPAPAGAAVLVAIACLLKTAQLPLHGWLMQVMEAPTPVSALLHAGVVNLGGVVLIRFAPLLQDSAVAQALLVISGTATAVLAGLVTTTRTSAKATLAWSTCAQMGFMVMQCGLGLYELALLHLVAHSLYKAHAFLRAGSTVAEATARSLGSPEPPASLGARLAALATAQALTFGAAVGLGAPLRPELLALAGVVGLALAPLIAAPRGWPDWRGTLAAAALALGYFAAHRLLHGRLGWESAPASPWAAGLVLTAFAAQFGVHCALALAPAHAVTRRLRTWLYAGLFLDERITRATLRLWPTTTRTPLAS